MPLVLAFLVGVADLAAETLVLRSTRFALGASAGSVTLALALALSGFGAGAALATRLSGSRAFAAARVGAGILALLSAWTPLVLAGSPGVSAATLAPVAAAIGAFAFALPAGASLPLLFAWTEGRAGRAAALLALNSLGGVAGAILGGLIGPTQIGTLACALAVLALDLAAAALALGASRALAEERPSSRGPAPAPVPDAADAKPLAALGLALGVGAATVGFETLLARVLPFFIGQRTDVLVTLLASALLGLSIGSALAGVWLQRTPAARLVLPATAALVAAGPCALWALEWLIRRRWIPAPASTSDFVLGRVLVGALLVAPPLLFAGLLSPIAFAFARGSGRSRAARLNLAYAVGALIPAIALPWCLSRGISTPTLLGAAGVVVFPGAFALARVRALILAVPIASGIFLGAGPLASRVPPFRTNPALEVLESREGMIGLCSAVLDRRRSERTLFTDAFRAAATGDDYRYTRSLAHMPFLLAAREPARAAVLAVGTGSTAAAAVLHTELGAVDLVEISEEVFDLAHWFHPASDALFERAPRGAAGAGALVPRAKRVVDDGRRFVAREGEPYDLIVLEPLPPDTPAAYPFYTQEFYALAESRLAPGGVLAQWIPIHSTEPRSMRLLIATFASAFTHRALYLVGESAILLGSADALTLAPARLDRCLADARLAADLRRCGCSSAGDLVAQCVLGDEGLAAFVTDHPLSDDVARIERIEVTTKLDVLRFELENLDAFLRARQAASEERLPGMETLTAGEAGARRSAGTAYLRARKAAIESSLAPATELAPEQSLASQLLEASAHPFAALDGQRMAAQRELVEGRTFLRNGEITRALPALERGAKLSRDPLAYLALATALMAASKEPEAASAAAIARLLLRPVREVALDAWPELKNNAVLRSLDRALAAGDALAARAPEPPSTIRGVADFLASNDPAQRVAGTVGLIRNRDVLSLEVEMIAAEVVTRSPAETRAALAVAHALEDPTLAVAQARLEAALAR